MEIRRKNLPIFGSKIAKSDYFQGFYFSQSVLSHIIGNNIAFVFLIDWKLRFFLKEFLIYAFLGQNVGPVWVKNDKKGYFHTSHFTPNPVFPKNKVLNSLSLLTH